MSVNKDKTGAIEDWMPALNLVNINTPYVEISPFWDDHTNTIYFASNGHAGFGGWDIYVAKGAKRDSIVNLGLPFNSSRDDFYFTLGKEKGYLVSNRDGGIGKDDIYTFDIHAKESEVGAIPKDSFADAQSVSSVGRIILGDNQVPVVDLPVYLKDETGSIIKEARTNANGEFRFENLAPDRNFKIIINSNDSRIRAKVEYFVNKQGKLEGKIFYNKANQMQAVNSNKSGISKSETPTLAVQNTTTVSTAESTSAAPSPVATKEPGTAPVAQEKPRTDKVQAVVKTKKAAIIKPRNVYFENVYYDFNSTEIPAGSKIVLDNLVNFLSNNKGVQVEIKAYTDGLGNREYNINLAKERGKACFDYLVSQGVDQSALLIIPAGDAQPVGKNSSFIGRQLNRRVQFTLLGASQDYVQETMVYIVEPRMGLMAIAQKFGMSIEELKYLNGITVEGITAYSPIRVKKSGKSNIAPETLEGLKQGKAEFRFENTQFVPAE